MFKDHFSQQAEIYQKARPTYPVELFEYLVQQAPARQLCWDCATGNGQAAQNLAQYFDRVIATDGSKSQIDNAVLLPNIEYRVALAENTGLPDNSADLITVATAAHWLNLPAFYTEAQRVAKPGGILAVWTYSEATINPAIDTAMRYFMYDFLKNYWPPERQYVIDKYESLPFPFKPISTPQFYCRRQWTKHQWLNYVKSWSSYNQYLQVENKDALEHLLPRLNTFWPDEQPKTITWQLHLKCTRLNA